MLNIKLCEVFAVHQISDVIEDLHDNYYIGLHQWKIYFQIMILTLVTILIHLLYFQPGWLVQLFRFQQSWIFWFRWNKLSWKLSNEIFCVASLFYQVISNRLSHSYQTNHNNDLISTANLNDSTRLKTILDTLRGILITWFN